MDDKNLTFLAHFRYLESSPDMLTLMQRYWYNISTVAEILDLKLSMVKKIESCELLPDEQLLNKFAKLYGCSVEFLTVLKQNQNGGSM
jgi:hypothetical protein